MDYLQTIEANKTRFRHYNDIKYQRFQQLIPNPNVKRVINSIPFLLGTNDKRLPGYVEGDVPAGVWRYAIDDETRRYIKGRFPTVKTDIMRRDPFVEMLAVMGSVGTVAYNKKSDFDYWVCVSRRSVTAEQFEAFRKKVDGIQRWVSKEIELPVHLFINDIESVKQNIFAEDDEEAFGTTVGAVLKDEFFRSSILVAGKIPFWWVVPKFARDEAYDELYERLPENMKEEFVDLGNLYEISREDFLGAALFQIIKSLGNPFKSIIKIGVLEKYIFGTGDSPLLSQKIKVNILRENLDNSVVDSYLLMFNEVFEYYSSTLDDKELVDILKRNLYLKVDPQISKYVGIKDKKNIPYKVAVMSRYVRAWGWDINIIRDLDNFEEWDFNKVMAFWDAVKRFMLLSYQKIATQLPSLKLEKRISETDFMLLSRKIKTHFAREQDKIDNFITFKDTPSEAILYIEPVSQGIHEVEWRLFKRNKSEKEAFLSTTLRVEKNLLRLLMWMAVNGVYDPVFSRINLQSGYTRVNPTAVTELLNQVTALFTGDGIRIKNQYFLEPAFGLVNAVILNFNRENAESIQTVHHLYYTSWGESFIKEYSSEEEIARVLGLVIRDGIHQKRHFDSYCVVHSPEPFKKLYKRISTMFKEAYSFIIEGGEGTDMRFVTQMKDRFVLISREGSRVTAFIYPGLVKLLTALTLKSSRAVRYRFHGEEGALVAFEAVYQLFRPSGITVVYEEKEDHMVLHVINESGCFFTFIKSRAVREAALCAMFDFCRNLEKRLSSEGAPGPAAGQTRFFLLRVDRMGKVALSEDTRNVEQQYLTGYKNSHALSASVARHMGEEVFYDIQFPDNVSSGFMTSRELYSAREKVKELRVKGFGTNTLLREVVFADLKPEDAAWGSTPYLLEKYRIELMMEGKK